MRLDPAEYERFIVLMNEQKLSQAGGKTLKPALDELITTRQYKELDDDRKIDRIRSYMQEAQDRARIAMLQEYPLLRRLVDRAHSDARQQR